MSALYSTLSLLIGISLYEWFRAFEIREVAPIDRGA